MAKQLEDADGLIGHPFQFEVNGKIKYAQITEEALEDCFKGNGESPETVFARHAKAIEDKAREIFLRNEFRSPFLLMRDDFK